MPTAHVNGIDVFYERGGDGPRLLFCNGSFATLATSAMLVDVFRGRFDTVAHDQRGLGRTEIPPGPYSMGDYAADALALADHVGWDTFRLVGISFGGMVAQEIAVTAPERIERLALLCTSPGGEGGSSYPMHELREMDPAERAEVSRRIMDTRFTPEWLAEHPADRMFVEGLANRPGVAPGSEAERGEREQAAARAHHDVWDRLARITCPTLVASGRYDGIAPLANGEAIASRIPGAELRVYEGGHGFFAQDRKAFPEVLDFLAG
ncbi:alpha/beta fold hydrolase [Rhabdothermincola salaria]|uniref:alpha/beta fold hydrolase n=1 Tax=Rhabdothermincola salaria TaxID=2903142 RepID=UPI001E56117B|nr:alpha/beta fold hydrolase [Rhabdothermincola salaria]MCD9625461.1 alpha/beta hydrolase [Rhabdothermincola salaria]